MGTPHLDLLERLGYEDINLPHSAFLSIHPFPDVETARKAILNLILDGFVELYSSDQPGIIIRKNEAKWILVIEEYWEEDTPFMLRITAEGLKWRWGEDYGIVAD